MQTDTYANLFNLIVGLTGNTTLTTEEESVVKGFINRRIYHAYRRSAYWPRYLVVGEQRAVSADGLVPFTQVTLQPIDTILGLYKDQPLRLSSVTQYPYYVDRDGAHVIGDFDDATTLYVTYKSQWEGPYTSDSVIPLEFFEYAAHAASADFLRYDKQHEKAAAEEAFAENLLVLELASVMRQANITAMAPVFRNHSTNQSRL